MGRKENVKALKVAVTGGCWTCRGSGQSVRYTQAAEVQRAGKTVSLTDMTAYGTCRDCRGTGKR